jgi:multidrug efflux pump subunit AcrB
MMGETAMNDIHQVEVLVHVDEALTEEQQASMVSNLQRRDGVEKVRFTTGRRHLMLIDYDPSKLHTIDVLGYVKQEKVHAELIGI